MAARLLAVLKRAMPYDAAALYWRYGEHWLLEAVSPGAGAYRPSADGVAVPLLDRMAAESQERVLGDVAADGGWQAQPLLRGVHSVLAVPVDCAGTGTGVLAFGWRRPGQAEAAEPGPLVEAATWLASWMFTAQAIVHRTAARSLGMQSAVEGLAGAGGAGAQGVFDRALSAMGWMAGGVVRFERLAWVVEVSSGIAPPLLRRWFGPGAAPLRAMHGKAKNAAVTILREASPARSAVLAVPLPQDGEVSIPRVLVLVGPKGKRVALGDLLEASAITEVVAKQLRMLQRESVAAERVALHQHVEALTLELGQKLTFEGLFQVLSHSLPQFVPASWVGLYRFPQAQNSGESSGPRLYEARVDGSGALQPPLLPNLGFALDMIDPTLPMTYLPGQVLPDGAMQPIVTVPVRIGHRIIAALLVAPSTTEEFSDHHLRVLRELSSSVALAVNYAQLFEQVERAKRDWEHTFDAITDTVAIITPERRIRRVNKTFALEHGVRPGDVIGRRCYQTLYNRISPCEGCQLDRALANKPSLGIEVEVRLDDGTEDQVFQATLFPIVSDADKVEDVVEFVKDITLSRQLQRKLLETDRLRALGELAGGAAHDFNNTLAGVVGQVDLLLEEVADPKLRQGLRVIGQAASDGAATVRRIQNFARTRRDEEVTAIDPNAILRDAVEVSAPRWKHESERAGIAIRVEQDLQASQWVGGVASELREVMVNIIFNAVEAMPAGGMVAVRSRDDGAWVVVEVTDTGAGMTEEVRRHVFDPFFTTKGVSNSGLGMSVVYGLIKLHRGDISVASQVGQGTTVSIRLPAAVSGVPHESEPSTEPPRQTGWDILVVEDDPKLADLLARMLHIDGHRVQVCTSGAQAIERLKAERFDVVLTDLGMPGVGGWEVVAAARALENRPQIALVTGWGVALEEWEIKARGVDAVIPKPYTIANIRATLTALAAGLSRSR